MKQTRAIVEGALTAALFIVILLASIYIPVLIIIGFFIWPLPMMYFCSKYGLQKGVIPLLVSAFLAFLFTDIITATVAFYMLIMGVVMGSALFHRKSAFVTLAMGTLANLIILIGVYFVLKMAFDFSPLSYFVDQFNQALDTSMRVMPNSMITGEEKDSVALLKNNLQQMVSVLAPALLVSFSVTWAFIIELISTPFLKRLRAPYPKWLPLREWRFPRSIIWYYLLSIVMMMFMSHSQGSMLYIMSDNVFYLLEIILAIQGVSFIFYFCYNKELNIAIPIIITIAGFIVPWLLYLIRLLGIIDLGFDLRKQMRKS
ncbi:hypothetical protein GCM10011391_35800 [Pullulanibacillus camelliae]|uniref:DUF2232 domain-containing protein n=1 Tax=Pullulanibacillus camelliae TaxID=1707096 RepID=A0A8J2YMI9_9BACL|nr:YybS family protein [Pullulanibacillus camelliae]GGE53721.1 hypothetical protein GCM10011391_35800 [Pullulanibacillus camelliae]